MLITDDLLTDAIRDTQTYKDYKKEFESVDVPTNQPGPVEYTQGTNRTPRATMTPNPNDVVQKKKRKEDIEKMVDEDEESTANEFVDTVLLEKEDSDDRLEPGSHKEKLENIDDDVEKKYDKKDDDDDHTDHALIITRRTGSLEIRTEKMQTPIPLPLHPLGKTYPRIRQELMAFNILTSRFYDTENGKKYATNRHCQGIKERVDEVIHDIVPKIASNATNDLIEDNLSRIVANAVKKDRESSQAVIHALISQGFAVHAPKIIEELFKIHMQNAVLNVYPTSRDDGPLEGEKNEKRQKTSKSSKSARGSLSKQPVKATKTSALRQQQQDCDAWVDDLVVDKDKVIPEDETPKLIKEFQNVDKRVPTIFDNKRMEATLRDMLRGLEASLYLNMKSDLQAQVANPELWDVLRAKFEKYSASAGSYKDDAFRKRDHDEHQGDDGPLDGEKNKKRQKTSKNSKSKRGSSSKQPVKATKTSASRQQQQDWDAWVDDLVVDKDEVILEDETPKLIEEFQNVDKRVPTIFDSKRMEATLRDMLRGLKANIEEKRYVLSLHKIHAILFPEEDLEEKMNRWVRKEFKTFNEEAQLSIQHWKDSWHKRVYKIRHMKVRDDQEEVFLDYGVVERVHDFYLGIESYQIKINLTAPTLIFLGIEKCIPFSIVDKPTTSLIYLNIKNENRFMDLEELSKFWDATLEKVQKEVKMEIFET
ncbi:hypothetical protein Tco_0907226 [Tanacetum coccineum]|uniref:Uncharacterized protein n=1 Tax=Tanacetum coccineum TaxID=301880 RepID=A0ABQ5CIN3_9ASTR